MSEPDLLDVWEAPPPEATRPVIRVRAGELPAMVLETIAALQRDPNLYQRAGQLVRIVREPQRPDPPCAGRDPRDTCRTCYAPAGAPCCGHDRRKGLDILTRPGTPRLRGLGAVLTERAAIVARWERWKATRPKKGEEGPTGEWVVSDPCDKTLGIVRAREDWPGIRPIRGILETPALAPSGRLISRPGYDEETCYVMLPSCSVGELPERPDQDAARAALRELWIEMACDFPFADVGEPAPDDERRELQFIRALDCPDAFVGVAALLTILARPAIDGPVPGFIFEAPGQGSGKSLQTHTIAMLATGRPAGIAAFPTRDGKPNEEELEKILAGYALAQARLVAFDNVRGVLGGSSLEGVLTCPGEKEFRVLGFNEQRGMPWLATLLFTGNNLSMHDDVAQRVLVSRIESPREDPRSRPASTFRHPNLLAALKAMRGELVNRALTILRAFIVAREDGRELEDTGTMGSFPEWSSLIPQAIRWAGGPNVLRARPELGHGGDEEGDAQLAILRGWSEAWNGSSAGELKTLIFSKEKDIVRGEDAPDGFDDVRAGIRTLSKTPYPRDVSGNAISRVLNKMKGKIRGGLRVVPTYDSHAKTNRFSVK